MAAKAIEEVYVDRAPSTPGTAASPHPQARQHGACARMEPALPHLVESPGRGAAMCLCPLGVPVWAMQQPARLPARYLQPSLAGTALLLIFAQVAFLQRVSPEMAQTDTPPQRRLLTIFCKSNNDDTRTPPWEG